MAKAYLDRIFDAGVVGAGGAGFPTHIKINNKAEVVIANGVECEPLLRIDRRTMELDADRIVEGMQIVMKISGAERGVICLKDKYYKAIEAITEAIGNKKKIELKLVGSYYPAGDEQQLVYEVTGKAVPCGGLPIDLGAIVCNVSTLVNIADAIKGIPVTDRLVTVTGEVNKPMTLRVPIGTSIEHLIKLAGGQKTNAECSVIAGGPAMGKVETDRKAPVTKTLGGIIVLPSSHRVVTKKTSSLDKDWRIARSVCCQCSFCTELCPRNALGLKVEPHKVMRAINYSEANAMDGANGIFSCCDCGICTLYACNMDLSPSRFMTSIKASMLKKGIKAEKVVPSKAHSLREFRKIPSKRFLEKLGLSGYDLDAPVADAQVVVDKVKIPLKQHIGVPAIPVVSIGAEVKKGDLIGDMQTGKVGAKVHASISGTVTEVNDQYIAITAR